MSKDYDQDLRDLKRERDLHINDMNVALSKAIALYHVKVDN